MYGETMAIHTARKLPAGMHLYSLVSSTCVAIREVTPLLADSWVILTPVLIRTGRGNDLQK